MTAVFALIFMVTVIIVLVLLPRNTCKHLFVSTNRPPYGGRTYRYGFKVECEKCGKKREFKH